MARYQKLIFMARVGLVSNCISSGPYSGSLCRLPSPLANSAKTAKAPFGLPLPRQKDSYFSRLSKSTSGIPENRSEIPFLLTHLHSSLFLSVTDYGCTDPLNLISFPGVQFSQLPLFVDICCLISPCRGFGLLFCFTLVFVSFCNLNRYCMLLLVQTCSVPCFRQH